MPRYIQISWNICNLNYTCVNCNVHKTLKKSGNGHLLLTCWSTPVYRPTDVPLPLITHVNATFCKHLMFLLARASNKEHVNLSDGWRSLVNRWRTELLVSRISRHRLRRRLVGKYQRERQQKLGTGEKFHEGNHRSVDDRGRRSPRWNGRVWQRGASPVLFEQSLQRRRYEIRHWQVSFLLTLIVCLPHPSNVRRLRLSRRRTSYR